MVLLATLAKRRLELKMLGISVPPQYMAAEMFSSLPSGGTSVRLYPSEIVWPTKHTARPTAKDEVKATVDSSFTATARDVVVGE